MEFLNKEGVQTLWSKVKDKVQSVNKDFVGLGNVTNDAQVKRSELGVANGVPTLDENGKIPVDQLGNLDTVVAMVVTELPTTDIKSNKIYLVKDSSIEGDLYQEYLYVDGKWEKIGTHKQEIDLTDYIKWDYVDDSIVDLDVVQEKADVVSITYGTRGHAGKNIDINAATETLAGAMTAEDKKKLDSLSNYTLPIASATALGGIKLGSGLSAAEDGTVSVSADVVAGAVEWDAIKNKPDVAVLNSSNSGEFTVAEALTAATLDGYRLTVSNKTYRAYYSTRGIELAYNDGGGAFKTVENKVFMTDGTTQELVAITDDELNAILV